ncbi:hypothetical protein N7508_000377 [Penicillium antarcticum]|uniref:uncharacterized protein n=1 Tax=Penicillium antarcticum TaxID=416450 RepID=UPI0023949454|nr:uncharacterized protein N7508_000377 [Penicillium antarcticum]KAJ5320094.1 hypothetical protein N7508_000377 [Penicillium antarcticum]
MAETHTEGNGRNRCGTSYNEERDNETSSCKHGENRATGSSPEAQKLRAAIHGWNITGRRWLDCFFSDNEATELSTESDYWNGISAAFSARIGRPSKIIHNAMGKTDDHQVGEGFTASSSMSAGCPRGEKKTTTA